MQKEKERRLMLCNGVCFDDFNYYYSLSSLVSIKFVIVVEQAATNAAKNTWTNVHAFLKKHGHDKKRHGHLNKNKTFEY